jgi:small GTP-binding protein
LSVTAVRAAIANVVWYPPTKRLIVEVRIEESSWIPMPDVRRMKTKLVLMGEGGVGKTSLVRRFVLNEYQDAYLHTVGTRVSKIELTVPHGANTEVQMDMAIFDIMGQKGFRDLVRETYYHGAQALMAVCDLTQKDSLSALDEWIPSALEITGDVPLYLVGNKKDLEGERAITDEDIRRTAETFGAPYVLASALSGESVEDVFNALAIDMVNRAFRQEDTRAAGRSLRQKALVLLDKRGSVGLKKHQFFEILRGVKFDELQSELDRLEREGLVTILWYGGSDFAVTITPRGVKALKQTSTWEE